MSGDDPHRYRLTLERFGSGGAPTAVRIRQVLKAARRLGLRCTWIDGGKATSPAGDASEAGTTRHDSPCGVRRDRPDA